MTHSFPTGRETRSVIPGPGLVLSLLWALLIIGACAPASHDTQVLAIVNGRPITLSEFDFRWSELPATTRERYESEGGKQRFLEELIARELLMQEARRLGLHRSPTIQVRSQRYKEKLLLEEVTRAVTASIDIGEEELEAYYAEHGAVLPPPDRIEVSQIVTSNVYAARDIRRMLGEGVSFATLARRYSIDEFSKSRGGEVGLYQKGTAPDEVEDVIYRLRPGRVSDPIKTESGYYLVKVTRRRPGDTKEVLQTRELLKQELIAEKRKQHVEGYLRRLKENAAIRIAGSSNYVTGAARAFRSSAAQ